MVVLVHGGLWEPMDADMFWMRPGIVNGLADFDVLAPDRLAEAPSWEAEAEHLAALMPRPAAVVAGSNGCSAAVRLALMRPGLVTKLVLAWPFTPRPDPDLPAALTDGDTLRGVRDQELRELTMPVAVLPSVPDNPAHQRRTVDALLERIPGATELAGCPEPPTRRFPPYLPVLLATLAAYLHG